MGKLRTGEARAGASLVDGVPRGGGGALGDRASLIERFSRVRGLSMSLASVLSEEDACVQAMADASPAKWHLAHTSWFFEEFVLRVLEPETRGGGFCEHQEGYRYLFNSYYNAVGERQARGSRGMLTRPSLGEVMAYRAAVDERVCEAIGRASDRSLASVLPVLETGVQHEQQHQELLLTDAKYLLWSNPMRPGMFGGSVVDAVVVGGDEWVSIEAGLVTIGNDQPAFPEGAFVYDCEGPVHKAWLEGYAVRRGAVTNGEYLAFMEDGGYGRAELWLDLGWKVVQREGWSHPLYWSRLGDGRGVGCWGEYTLRGEVGLDGHRPVSGLSFFEADAFARWAGKQTRGVRMATEQEWEHAAAGQHVEGNLLVDGGSPMHPVGHAGRDGLLAGVYGDVWEWTSSQFRAYPGYEACEGALGEYNGKFMCNQFVLRGGSCLTPADHVRVTYRNFFPPEARWQCAGLRLARDV